MRRSSKRTVLLLAAIILSSEVAADALGSVSSALTYTTDYRYNGASLSDNGPAWQGYLHWTAPAGFHAGAWCSQVDFNDPGETSIECDLYAGRRFALSRASTLKLEGMYSRFNDNVPGPTYDFYQGKATLTHSIGSSEVALYTAWSPEGSYGSGTNWQLRAEASTPISRWMRFSAKFGRAIIENRRDRTYWDLGVTADWWHLSFDIRYIDSDATAAACGGTNRCDATIIGSVTIASFARNQ